MTTTTRGELLELMAYDRMYGLPDSPEKTPGAPVYRKQPKSGDEQLAMFRAAFG